MIDDQSRNLILDSAAAVVWALQFMSSGVQSLLDAGVETWVGIQNVVSDQCHTDGRRDFFQLYTLWPMFASTSAYLSQSVNYSSPLLTNGGTLYEVT